MRLLFSPLGRLAAAPWWLFTPLLALALAGCYGAGPRIPDAELTAMLAGPDSAQTRIWRVQTVNEWGVERPAPACLADNDYIFRADGSFRIANNALMCTPGDLAIADGQWYLRDEGRTLLLDHASGFEVRYALLVVNDFELRFGLTNQGVFTEYILYRWL